MAGKITGHVVIPAVCSSDGRKNRKPRSQNAGKGLGIKLKGHFVKNLWCWVDRRVKKQIRFSSVSLLNQNNVSDSLNFIRLLRVAITPSVNDSKQSDEFEATFRTDRVFWVGDKVRFTENYRIFRSQRLSPENLRESQKKVYAHSIFSEKGRLFKLTFHLPASSFVNFTFYIWRKSTDVKGDR